jgi:DNA-directed RNA polymerase subunit RPC12/RpoP
MDAVQAVKTGKLIAEGQGRTGNLVLQYYKCVDCGTSFPEIDGEIRCNRAPIVVCPYCEPNSKPFKNGRGPL